MSLALSVLFSTYNSPRWLEKVFWGLAEQTHDAFEIIVADDGSTDDTRQMVASYTPEFERRGIAVRHVWQDDDGFRKCRILNKAILHARHDYIVFTDGDCILRNDFLAVHAERAEAGHYLSGSYYKLPMSTSELITRDDVTSGRCFDRAWLRDNGLPGSASWLKLNPYPRLAPWLNRLTPTACNLKGSNASVWREDLLASGGFDERMQWGGLDRELGVRLQNRGIRARHVRYDAICVHLDHARGYRKPELVAANRQLRERVAKGGVTHTDFGIDRLLEAGYSVPSACALDAGLVS